MLLDIQLGLVKSIVEELGFHPRGALKIPLFQVIVD